MKRTILLVTVFMLAFTGCKQKPKHQLVCPLPSGLDIEHLTDAQVAAVFTMADWGNGQLTMDVYAEDIYDMVLIHNLTQGDTLIYDGERIVVNTIVNKDAWLSINGGLYEGGADLEPYEGGTYRAVQDDDHSIYSLVGTVTLPLSETLSFTDCGEEPLDSPVTIHDNILNYIASLPFYKQEFSYLDTRVLIENGFVTHITRHWIP